jgi:hypothetical protein
MWKICYESEQLLRLEKGSIFVVWLYMKKRKVKEQEKKITLDLPEVKDIPGQEFIKPPRIREMEDMTASSTDEDGDHLSNENSVSIEEKAILRDMADGNSLEEERELKSAVVDSTDDNGDPLNEETEYYDLGASDLDIPDDYEDDEDEELGKVVKVD